MPPYVGMARKQNGGYNASISVQTPLVMPRVEAYGSSFVCLSVCHSVCDISFAVHIES